ncbi:putative inorganic phosphate cotransporter isoform X1 [Stegodyphus dumicola]|uniref:putative inorganic phosphate cotransporter isoform X1 n=2 Tax=Stegodyphus dumicola TaxID=202533 RepID=UPI0015B2C0C0|nr:putative inorganic phosphate cotransporter isoform X1 [Stegodyphus dumicola]
MTMKPKYQSLDAELNEKSPILGTNETRCTCGFPARYALALLGFIGIFNVYAMRVNLSVALVAMVRKPHLPSELESEGTVIACRELVKPFSYTNTSAQDLPRKGEFDWDSNTQGLILGSFFYGYVATQIPGGIIAEKYGAKWLFGVGVLITAVFTLLTPVAARLSVWALVVTRIIEGLGEGVTFPAMNALIGRWVPKLERSRIATLIYSGSPLGTVVALSVSGILSASDFLGGWPSVFYVFGLVGIVWFFFWITLVFESPDEHPRISKEELNYIHQGQDKMSRNTTIPWKSILTSVPVWALVLTHFGQNWGFYTLLTEMPTYLSNILHFDLKKNGTLSALPYLMQAVCAMLASISADKLRATNRFTITTIRKIINSIAFFGPGVCVLAVAFVGCNPVIIVVLLTVSLGLNGFMFSGFNVTHVDMSPEFAGTLMGITNCFANLAGFLAPAYVGYITHEGQSVKNWGIVFLTAAAVYFCSGLLYDFFCSAELQPWGRSQESEASEQGDNKSQCKKPSIENVSTWAQPSEMHKQVDSIKRNTKLPA